MWERRGVGMGGTGLQVKQSTHNHKLNYKGESVEIKLH